MTEHEREKEFPIHVELGKKFNDSLPGMLMKNSKKEHYPTLYIGDVEGLENLPEEGCILVDFKRRSLSIHKREGKNPTCSVELEIRTICMPEEYEENAEDLVDELVKKAYKHDAEEEEDEEDETEEYD